MQEEPCIVVLITAPSAETARQLAQSLLEQRLAACVNLLPGIQSIYIWEEKIQQDEEMLMLVKTRLELFERLAAAVKALHPYQVPEIIALPIQAGTAEYLGWVAQAAQPDNLLTRKDGEA